MEKKPLYYNVKCFYCGLNQAHFSVDMGTRDIKLTVPLCNSCALIPEIVLTDQLIPKPKMRSKHEI